MKTSAVFMIAKEHTWDGVGKWAPLSKTRFICMALLWAPAKDRDRCRKIIQRLLAPNGRDYPQSLEDWLIQEGHMDRKFLFRKSVLDHPDVLRKAQITRLAWLDHLIEFYQAQGD